MTLAGLGGASHPFLLERGPSGGWARSMAGADPLRVLEFTGGEGSLRHRDGRLEMLEGDPLASLAALVASAPGGCVAVGYLGYDLGLALERLRARSARDHRFPDLWFGLYDRPGGL
ncbi:MAG: hypothetical protein HY722_09560, partial [Planctomycetes bacterium]|nr:hypothetical protein [Planctomycetota bacterium]